jgi:linoleoyl-CoA desaturase
MNSEGQTALAEPPVGASGPNLRLKFTNNNGFQIELRRRVEEFFRLTGRRQRDCPRMYLKTAILFATLAASYFLLVFAATTWWQVLPLAIILGLTVGAIGFNVQHDGGHNAYSNYKWVNKLMARSLDFVGGSSYLWHWKHAIFHHTYCNVSGHDTDIDAGPAARLSPHQKRHWFHRWQHIYLWPLYGTMAIRWQFIGDLKELITGHIGPHRYPRPRGKELAVFFGGKIWFFTMAFAIPLMFHPVWAVLATYAVAASLLGVALSIVFQLAHCVEEADFPLPDEDSGRIENAWAVHQVETTVDFARRSRLACWLLGGLNFQVEHHLFPRICHVNYPDVSKIVEQTCREFGVRYRSHGSFWSGMVAHYRWLYRLGQPVPSAHTA